MSSWARWWRFNLVGLMGVVVQLATLALLSRVLPSHYLWASAAALELTLLHNFVWHLHYTWRDRHDTSARLPQLLRFHLSNGSVSMLGNLALMRLLVRHVHAPVLVANAIAIVCCSLANFCLGETWAFARTKTSHLEPKHRATASAAASVLTCDDGSGCQGRVQD